MSIVQKQISVLSFSGKSRQKCVSVVRNHTSRCFAPDPADPPDLPETVAAIAGANLPSTCAGGQDDGSFTQAPSNYFVIIIFIFVIADNLFSGFLAFTLSWNGIIESILIAFSFAYIRKLIFK